MPDSIHSDPNTVPGELDPLVERLRNLDWPTPTDDIRQRALAKFQARLDELDGTNGWREPPEREDRHPLTRRLSDLPAGLGSRIAYAASRRGPDRRTPWR